MPQPSACSICDDATRLSFVSRLLAQGYSSSRVEAASRTEEARERGVRPVKAETVARHKVHAPTNEAAPPPSIISRPTDLMSEARNEAAESAARVSDQSLVTKGSTSDPAVADVAALVAAKGVEMLQSGTARVTVQHALQAQQMLDRREERRKDRELALTFARMMTAPQPPARLVTVDAEPVIIEGEVVRVG